jgi:hypothetical protein
MTTKFSTLLMDYILEDHATTPYIYKYIYIYIYSDHDNFVYYVATRLPFFKHIAKFV